VIQRQPFITTYQQNDTQPVST